VSVNTAFSSANRAANISRLAAAALWVSVFSFVLPFGIGALVMAYMAQREIRDSRGRVGGADWALAALIIAYTQIGLVCLAIVFGWSAFHDFANGFRRDAVLQQMFRSQDQMRPLSQEEAAQESTTALELTYQVIAIQDAYYRASGSYRCNIQAVIGNGLESTTDAEKRVTMQRFQRSPYIYEISGCPLDSTVETTYEYRLVAVPLPPRMPDNSQVFCADQSGEVRRIQGGTSLDCFDHGSPAR